MLAKVHNGCSLLVNYGFTDISEEKIKVAKLFFLFFYFGDLAKSRKMIEEITAIREFMKKNDGRNGEKRNIATVTIGIHRIVS